MRLELVLIKVSRQPNYFIRQPDLDKYGKPSGQPYFENFVLNTLGSNQQLTFSLFMNVCPNLQNKKCTL